MLDRLYRSIWLLFNLLAASYDWLCWFLLQLQATYRKSYDLLSSGGKSQVLRRDIAFLERCKVELSKIPRHLNIIVGPEEVISPESLLRAVVYALSMDIDCISFYDTRPLAKVGRRRKITIDDMHPPKNVCSVQLDENRLLWSISTLANGKRKMEANGCATVNANGSANGAINGEHLKHGLKKSIEVVMLGSKEGRPLIAEVCKELFEKRETAEIQNLLMNRTMLMERINQELSQRLNKLPDPELSIVFNRHTCTFGLMPWQTRFTEFQTIQTGDYLDVETFASVLYRYSRCEQRWGK